MSREPFVALASLLGSLLSGGCDPHTSVGGPVRTSGATIHEEAPEKAEPAAWKGDTKANGGRVPVVVELFSSEGCSSCPPADEALRHFDEDQPVDGALIIPLELHVDYWNDLGWADPFSRPEYSLRQHAYADSRRAHGVFTPEAIVDGSASVLGSDRDSLADRIKAAALRPHVDVEVSVADDKLHVSVPSAPVANVEAWLAYTQPGLSTDVTRGENSGHTLKHGPVVRSLIQIGPVTKKDFEIAIGDLPVARQKLRAVILLQSDSNGSMVGAATTKL